jgi:hypothetical protein
VGTYIRERFVTFVREDVKFRFLYKGMKLTGDIERGLRIVSAPQE